MRVRVDTRDQIKALAETDGISMEEEIRRLARQERQRRMGIELSTDVSTAAEQAVLDAGAVTIQEHA